MNILKMAKRSLLALSALAAMLLTGLAHAENSVVAITGLRNGNVEQVRIDFRRELTALPKAFMTRNPSRLALDFAGLGSAM